MHPDSEFQRYQYGDDQDVITTIPGTKKLKQRDSVWAEFNDLPNNHQQTEGICKWCNKTVAYQKQCSRIRKHMEKCEAYRKVLIDYDTDLFITI